MPSKFPGPRAFPLLGWWGNAIVFARDPTGFLHRLRNDYGEVAAIARGVEEFTFFFNPDHVRQIFSDPTRFLNTDIDTSTTFRFPEGTAYTRLFSGGLNQMNGPRHRQQRRLMMPSFHKKYIEGYREKMIALTEQKLAGWGQDRPFDLLQEMRELTSSIAVKCFFGLDPAQEGAKIREMLEAWQRLFFSPWSTLVPFNLPGLTFRRLLQLSEAIEAEVLGMIARKRNAGTDEGDVLSTLLQAYDEEDGSRLSDNELVGQIITLFIAGHETTASTLSWALLLLALHPEISADFLSELAPLQGQAPAADGLNTMPILDGVVKETLRMFPPLLWQLRYTTEATIIGDYEISAGKGVCVSAFIAHRNPEIFEKPDCFRPSRWQDLNPSPYEYFPFSGGPRLCLGAAFATMEMKIVLPLIMQRCRLELPPGAKIDRQGMVLSAPSKGIPITIHPQDAAFTHSKRIKGNMLRLIDFESNA
jgi:cytochrome P450